MSATASKHTVVDTSSNFGQLPTFEEAQAVPDDHVIDFANTTYSLPGGEEPPPEFTPYEAEYFQTGNGDVISHDDHLNEDGGYPCCCIRSSY
jgi:hypothetical protein